ncbi:MAG: CoA transferase [Desulfurellaceae bacterium]|nr:CoA transferase [Desulfurellaceae bacterium]
MAGCLDGIKVLDLGRYQAGPRCAMVLSDLGAEVIKVEAPGGDESRGLGRVYWSAYNRGKKSITLNLRSEQGIALLKALVPKVDMLLQNFRPGVMDKMGLGYETLKQLNSGLILINVSGFGQSGPYRDRPAYDPIGQAMSGLMGFTGFPDGPPVMTNSPIIDRITALHATIGALGALHHRDVTGEGQSLDVCLLDTGYTLMEIPIAQYLLTDKEPPRRGNTPGGIAPCNTYQAKDGWVYILAVPQHMWGRFCRGIGREDLTDDKRFSSIAGRASHADEVNALVDAWVRDKTVAEVVQVLEQAEVPVGPVHTIPQAAHDPHLWERKMLVETEDHEQGHTYVPGLTVKFSDTPGKIGPIPQPGEHNGEVYGEWLGHTEAALTRWKEEGIV